MTAVFVLSIIFGAITAWVLGPRWIAENARLRELELKSRSDPKQLEAIKHERAALEERLRNLETIVCGVDLELNAKLNRMASRQLLLQAASPSTPPEASASPEASSPTLLLPKLDPGARIGGRFVIQRLLGTGGMGAVYLARDEALSEPVALKLIREAGMGDAQAADRFKREASAARRITHPNVVRLHDIGEERGVIFLSMEYVEGEGLRAILNKHGSLPPPRVREIVAQLCDGVGAAHAAGVVHRDLKPENVIIGPGGQPKIIDFGVAKLAELENMTATRIILGTPHYMAPEQVRGQPIDARTDLYALGVITYEALSGKPPFDGQSAIGVSFAHCNEAVPSILGRRPELPPAWEAFVMRALEKEPSRRFSSAAEMRAALPVG